MSVLPPFTTCTFRDMQGGFFPRISTQAYAAVFPWDAPVQAGAPVQAVVPLAACEAPLQDVNIKLVELVHYLRLKDLEGIYSGSDVHRGVVAHKLNLPHTFESLEAKLCTKSYGLEDFAIDIRCMCGTAVQQLFHLDTDLAQKASDLLSEANARLYALEHVSRATTPDAHQEDVPVPTNLPNESFWVPDLEGVSSLLILDAKRVGISSRPAGDAELFTEASVAGPRFAGVKRKAKVLDEDKATIKKVEWSFSAELQTHLAGLIETVAAQLPDPAIKGPEPETAQKGIVQFARACKQQAEKLRGSHAAELCRMIDFDFGVVCSRLRAGDYADVDAVCADVADVGRAAAERASEEQAGMRRGKLRALADQWVTALCSSLEELVGQQHERVAGPPAAPPTVQVVQPVRYVPLPECMQANKEPYLQADWRQEPYAPRPYVRLTNYELKEDADALAWKLKTTKQGSCEGNHCTTREGLGEYKMDLEGFETKCQCLSKNMECGPACGCADTGLCLNRAVTERHALKVGQDVKEVNSWGMDCYTRRNIQDAVLESEAFGPYIKPDYAAKRAQANPLQMGETIHHDLTAPAVSNASLDHSGAGGAVSGLDAGQLVNDWIERTLLPAINRQGNRGWDVLQALDDVRKHATTAQDARCLRAVKYLDARVRKVGQDFFRIHPKGVGMVCLREGGLPPLTFVEEYLGEVHPPWRWFEMQDAIKKGTNDELPDFYNIVLERPKDDPAGYDVLFVDAASKGAFASRMSHSCSPNCQAVVMACGGRLTIAVYTLRHVHQGEELTFDYASVTESEKEFRAAICLCSTPRCRGSFLYFAGSRAFSQVLNENHTMLHRQAMLLQANVAALNDADKIRMAAWGIGESVLGRTLAKESAPLWLQKWAALVLEFIEEERSLLPDQLCSLQLPYASYTRSAAEIEAKGIADNRLQNVAITLDKVKLCLRKPGQLKDAPLRRLSEQQALEHIWSGPKSIARRLLRSVAPQLGGQVVAQHLDKANTESAILDVLDRHPGHPHLERLAHLIVQPAETFQDARKQLLAVVDVLRDLDVELRGGHTAAADILTLYAHTTVWFTAERNYKGFTSQPVKLNLADLKLQKANSNGGPPPKVRAANGSTLAKKARQSSADSGDGDTDHVDEPVQRRIGGLNKADLSKKYGPWFMWGQLNTWFKQTVYDPSATLSAGRRGTISLPDIESCYSGPKSRYTTKDREIVLEQIQKRPDAMWKSGTIFSFKNEAKVYGSPMFDAVFWKMYGGPPSPMDEVMRSLRGAKTAKLAKH